MVEKKELQRRSIYTIGHSNRSITEFTALLKAHDIRQIVDVRTVPKSRHNPQFNEKRLGRSLRKKGIEYIRLEELGGFRHAIEGSKNLGWRNLSFRGFADYMGTSEFAEGLGSLEKLAGKKKRQLCVLKRYPGDVTALLSATL